MGAVPSTPRGSSQPHAAAEHLIGEFVGEKSYPISSDFWKRFLVLPLTIQWPQRRIHHACQIFVQNNYNTRHLGKILIHLVLCLRESSSANASLRIYSKAVNAAYISSVFLKYFIEIAKSENFEELCLDIDEEEKAQVAMQMDESVESFFIHNVLSYLGSSTVSQQNCLLHYELLNLILIAMSTQLRSGPSVGTIYAHPFIDEAMLQDNAVVVSVVRKLLLNFISKPCLPLNNAAHLAFSEANQPSVLQRVGSAAANFVMLPYYTFNYLVSSSGDCLRSPLADKSLLVLLILLHYRKCIVVSESKNISSDMKDNQHFYENLYNKAIKNARDVDFDRTDIEGNAVGEQVVRLPFASLFDTLAICLSGESSVLLLYSLVHGNPDFLDYVLVRTDLDTLLVPILGMLYNPSRQTSNQIYLLLIILLILTQDSSFNASIHKLILPNVPWYKERLLHQTSLGSLMIVILIRTVKYNLSKLKDLYLHTNCLAILANMAPHVHRLSAYASQRLVSLFDMLSRKYNKLAEHRNEQVTVITDNEVDSEKPTELHIYTDFLRIVLEILNSILTYALPRNPEVVYAILHRQEIFEPFKNHPRFKELLDNIFTVLDFFNSCMDKQQVDAEWSVNEVLQLIITSCRSWRAERMRMFDQLRFTYEQENHPEEFFIPYVWRLVLSNNFSFEPSAINLFPVDLEFDDDHSSDLDI